MPTSTYVALATTTLGASASSVTFSSIPASYRDLVLVVGGLASSQANFYLQFNNDTGTNYSWVNAVGYSSSAASGSSSSDNETGSAALIGSSQSTILVNLLDYSATDKHKSLLLRSMGGTNEIRMGAARWANTAAINEIDISLNTGTLSSGSTFSLFGIEA